MKWTREMALNVLITQTKFRIALLEGQDTTKYPKEDYRVYKKDLKDTKADLLELENALKDGES